MAVIIFKVMVATATGLLGAAALRSRGIQQLPDRQFLRVAIALQLVPALGLFVALYVIGHQEVTSDVPGYYLPAAREVLAGKLPFRDFTLSYAPLFPYVGAALIQIWDSGKAFALFAILLNALALIPWHVSATACFGRETARSSSILYATSGHLTIQALLGTNQAWIAATLACSAFLIVRGREAASGLTQAFAVCTTKFLALLFWPAQWLCATRRIPWVSAAALTSALVYGAFELAGGSMLAPLRREGELISSGNLAYLLEPLLPMQVVSSYHLFDVVALAALGVAILWLYLRARSEAEGDRPRLVLASLALTGVVFMLTSKKSFTGYVVFFMYPLIPVLVSRLATLRARVGFLLVFNALLVSEPSLWFHLGGNGLLLSAWLQTSHGAAIGGFVLLDIALVGCYVFIAWLCVRCLRTPGLRMSAKFAPAEPLPLR